MNRHQPYRPLLSQPPADSIRVDTCDTRRFPIAPSATPCSVQPLKGLRENHTHVLSYRAFAPAGAGVSLPTANYSLLTANSTAAFPAPPVPLIQHSALVLHLLRQRELIRANTCDNAEINAALPYKSPPCRPPDPRGSISPPATSAATCALGCPLRSDGDSAPRCV